MYVRVDGEDKLNKVVTCNSVYFGASIRAPSFACLFFSFSFFFDQSLERVEPWAMDEKATVPFLSSFS